jgi:hypothetical protein
MRPFLAPLLAAVALVGAAAGARADTSWTYSWSSVAPVSSTGGNFQLNFTPTSAGTIVTPTGATSSDISAGTLSYSLLGSPSTNTNIPDSFTNKSFVLSGLINGQQVNFTVNFTTPSIATTTGGSGFSVQTNPMTWSAATWGPGGSGGYSASIVAITSPSSDGASGNILVNVEPATGTNGHQPPPNGTPEPSTMLLSCVGLAFGGIATWRKRRQALVS